MRIALAAAAILTLCLPAAQAQDNSHAVRDNVVLKESGRFLGWPANYGIWSWENEIVVGFTHGYYKENPTGGHDIDPDKKSDNLQARSLDGGETWTRGKDSQFPNPNAAVGFIKLQNGHLLLAYNDNMNERIPLTIAVSEDNDKTWPHRRDVVAPGNTFAYPMAIQAKDGTIYVVYTTDSRATVMLASFKEEAILGHTK